MYTKLYLNNIIIHSDCGCRKIWGHPEKVFKTADVVLKGFSRGPPIFLLSLRSMHSNELTENGICFHIHCIEFSHFFNRNYPWITDTSVSDSFSTCHSCKYNYPNQFCVCTSTIEIYIKIYLISNKVPVKYTLTISLASTSKFIFGEEINYKNDMVSLLFPLPSCTSAKHISNV